MNQLIIPKHIYDEMIAHCRAGYPDEACGILAGSGNEITKIYRMANSESSPVSYMMDPSEQAAVNRDLRANSLAMISIFHSHPSSAAYPSQKDRELALWDGEPAHGDAVYVIVSLCGEQPVAKAFSIKSEEIRAIEIAVKQTPAD